MSKLVLALLLVACGPPLSRVWPVSPDIARASSFDLLMTRADGTQRHGTAWVVDHYHLITAASRCDASSTHAIAVSHLVYADVIGPKLCLLSSDTDLGYPLIIADSTPRRWRQLKQIVGFESTIGAAVVATWNDDSPFGDPLNVRSGVIGLVLEPGKYVGVSGLHRFLTRHDVDWHDEPSLPGPFNYAADQLAASFIDP